MSGHTDTLLVSLGAASAVLCVFISRRMDVVDHEGHPLHLGWKAIVYWPWLAWEIVKANIDVTKIILSPKMSISPMMFKVKASQQTEIGHVTYGNSITLTPGTVTVALVDDDLTVHAITQEMADGVKTGDMDRRVTQMEGNAVEGYE